MSNILDDLLGRLTSGFSSSLHLEGDTVRVNLIGPAADFELRLKMPDPATAARIREREGAAYSIPIGMQLVNRKSGKDVRGFNKNYINAWWLHWFVLEIAGAVAYIEREWDVLSPAFIAKMEADEE